MITSEEKHATREAHDDSQSEQEREMVVVLSDRLSIALLAVTWVLLLGGVLWLWKRNRTLHNRLAQIHDLAKL